MMRQATCIAVLMVAVWAVVFCAEGNSAPQPGIAPTQVRGGQFSESKPDQLSGKWLVCEGRSKDDGFYFDETLANTCGEADFRPFVNKVKLEPIRLPGSPAVPWGEYLYRLDESDILTLTQPQGPSIKCFVKYEQRRPMVLGPRTAYIPYVLVFYEPSGRRAFKLMRKSEEIAKWAVSGKTPQAGAVFVPHQDRLTGSWVILPHQPTGTGQLEFRLDGPPPAESPRLNVLVSNRAEIRGAGLAIRFRLRQYGPTQWAIETLPDSVCSTGTITLEQAASRIAGPNVLVSRWQIGPTRMTTALKAEGNQRPANVPAIRFDGALPLDFELLRLGGQARPTTGTVGLAPR